MIRLQKYIASCGAASRRAAEEMIASGRVSVNGKTVTEMGVSIDEYNDEVMLDGRVIVPEEKKVYILLSKPKGYVTTACDDHGRPTVLDLVDVPERVFPVGRLDLNTASAEELSSLMYIDEESAELIIDYRENNGGFKDVEDICNVKGLTLIRQKVIIDNCFVQDLGGN